jgi:hypothetical protein
MAPITHNVLYGSGWSNSRLEKLSPLKLNSGFHWKGSWVSPCEELTGLRLCDTVPNISNEPQWKDISSLLILLK